MERIYQLNNDYNHKEKLKKEDIFCYSKNQLKKLYSNGNYKIVGEIKGDLADENDPDYLLYRNHKYKIKPYGTASKIIYGRKRFISVGNDEYVVLLNNKIIFIILLLIIAILIGLLLTFILKFGINLINPVPSIDPNLNKIEGDTSEKIESESGGGSVSIAYSLDANLSLASSEIAMTLGNPNESNHQMIAELYIENGGNDVCIAKSGLINPGYQLNVMKFNHKVQLTNGLYSGYYYLKFYNPDTGELALLESKIENVVISVSD